MKRPLTNVEIMADNMRKAELFDNLVKKIGKCEIIVSPAPADGVIQGIVSTELDLIDLIHGRGEYEGSST